MARRLLGASHMHLRTFSTFLVALAAAACSGTGKVESSTLASCPQASLATYCASFDCDSLAKNRKSCRTNDDPQDVYETRCGPYTSRTEVNVDVSTSYWWETKTMKLVAVDDNGCLFADTAFVEPSGCVNTTPLVRCSDWAPPFADPDAGSDP